ncbi:hypothetical protein BAUCODRAFT_27096 [Baudoinia panamericana UAMH 10762]|uniref:Uncharacterized protein n=1 Tax=Baudoinia panamericana (strain UAMH 10762) TaxID=717646 RepID=M2N1D5_BAUPA|nr:uncharacterized protein BAUCODRAFT_27096 [Baudoinia panamericana UAMH 10762]EMC92749.1 hypothetical protein BAUCODRAFT_27096 [Baudoinia panamericana UAMH 10762]
MAPRASTRFQKFTLSTSTPRATNADNVRYAEPSGSLEPLTMGSAPVRQLLVNQARASPHYQNTFPEPTLPALYFHSFDPKNELKTLVFGNSHKAPSVPGGQGTLFREVQTRAPATESRSVALAMAQQSQPWRNLWQPVMTSDSGTYVAASTRVLSYIVGRRDEVEKGQAELLVNQSPQPSARAHQPVERDMRDRLCLRQERHTARQRQGSERKPAVWGLSLLGRALMAVHHRIRKRLSDDPHYLHSTDHAPTTHVLTIAQPEFAFKWGAFDVARTLLTSRAASPTRRRAREYTLAETRTIRNLQQLLRATMGAGFEGEPYQMENEYADLLCRYRVLGLLPFHPVLAADFGSIRVL